MKKQFTGACMVLLIGAFMMVGTASDHSPPIEKAKTHVEQIDNWSQVIGNISVPMVMHVAIVPAYAFATLSDITQEVKSYQEQAHPNSLISSASKQELKFNRMRNARWQSSFDYSDNKSDKGESG